MYKSLYGQTTPPIVQEDPVEEDVLVQVQQVYDAAGNLLSEVREIVTDDPEMEPVKVAPAPVQTGVHRIARYLADANDDERVTTGEAKVFGFGMISGWLLSRLLR